MPERQSNLINETIQNIKIEIEKLNTLRLESNGVSKIVDQITYDEKDDIWSIKKPLFVGWFKDGEKVYMTGLIKIKREGEHGYSKNSEVEIIKRTKKNYNIDYFVRPHLDLNPEIKIDDLGKYKEVTFQKLVKEGEKIFKTPLVLSYSPSSS